MVSIQQKLYLYLKEIFHVEQKSFIHKLNDSITKNNIKSYLYMCVFLRVLMQTHT